jgi:hypothetical protein
VTQEGNSHAVRESNLANLEIWFRSGHVEPTPKTTETIRQGIDYGKTRKNNAKTAQMAVVKFESQNKFTS